MQEEGEAGRGSTPRGTENDKAPRRASGDKAAVRTGGDKAAVRTGGDKPPRRAVSDKAVARAGGDKAVVRAGGDKVAVRADGDKVVVRAAGARGPAQAPRAAALPAVARPLPPAPAPTPGWRADRGPRPLAALMPTVTRPVFKKHSPAASQLIADWPALVGPVLAAQTIPRALAGGTLTLACTGPVAMELQHLAPQLIGRINVAMGQGLVQRLRFVQAAMPPLPARAVPPAPVVLPARLTASLEDVADPALREALARWAQGVYRGRRDPA